MTKKDSGIHAAQDGEVADGPLERAVRLGGGQSGLKRRLEDAGEKISQQAIGLWLKAGKIGDGWALPVSRAIDYQVTPHELDAKAYPNPWDGLPLDRARPLILELAA